MCTVDRPFDDPQTLNSTAYQIISVVVLLGGMGSILYVLSTLMVIVVEGVLSDVLRRRRMQAQIDRLRGHVIICGAGTTGVHVVDELHKLQKPFVVIERDTHRLDRVRGLYRGLLCITGDATEEGVLIRAGIERARGVISALRQDADNLFVTMTARQLNPGLRIVSRVMDLRTEQKMRKAGADSVVSPNFIGGLRMAGEMVHPKVVHFMDAMLRDPFQTTRIDEVRISEGSDLIGKTLGESRLGSRAGVLVLAVKQPDEERLTFRPPAETPLRKDGFLVVMGSLDGIEKTRKLAKQPESLPE